MVPRRYRVALWVVPLVAIAGLTVALLNPDSNVSVFGEPGIGFIFGVLFGHTTLASTWTAFGPAPLVWRLPLSLLWVASLVLALAINLAIYLGFHGGFKEMVVLVGCCLLGQWFLVQLPLWGLAMKYRLRLRHLDDAGTAHDRRASQFGIGQLMIVTLIVGVLFGGGRLIVTGWGDQLQMGDEVAVFAFLGGAAIVMTLPLVLAAFMSRWALPAVLLMLALIGLATAWEVPLLRNLGKGVATSPVFFYWINGFTAAWILAIAAVVRLNGYQLAGPASNAKH